MTSGSPRKPLVVGTIGIQMSEMNTLKTIQQAGSAVIVSTDERGTMSLDPHNPDMRSEPPYTTEPCMCGQCRECGEREKVERRAYPTRPYAAAMGMALCSDMLNRPAFRRQPPPTRGDKAVTQARCMREGCSCAKTYGKPYCSPECARLDKQDKRRKT